MNRIFWGLRKLLAMEINNLSYEQMFIVRIICTWRIGMQIIEYLHEEIVVILGNRLYLSTKIVHSPSLINNFYHCCRGLLLAL